MAKEFRQLALVAVFSLTILVVVVSIWAGSRADEIRGPTVFVRDHAGDLWISVNRDLYEINTSGEILQTIETQGDEVLEKGIQALDVDAWGDLLVGYGKTEKIHRLSPETGELLEVLAIASKAPTKFPGDAYKFAIESETGDLFLADTRNHHIRIFNAERELKGTFGEQGENPEQFHFPNDIRFGPDGLLYISDTNNHRIGAFDRAGDHRFSVKTIDSEVSSEMVWPTRFIFASDGSIFVINKGPMLVGGEIVRLHREDGILDRIELPPGADPMKLLPVDGDLWVTDEARCQGSRYTLEGERLENVESGEFEELLSALHFERTYYRSITSKAQRGLFILLLLLIVIYFFERRQKANEVAVEDPLAGRLDLREIPMIAFPLKKKLKCAALLVGVWFGGSILITLIVMGLSVVGESTADGEVGSLAFRIVTWLLLLTLAGAIFFIFAGAVRGGAFHRMNLKRVEKVFDKQKGNLGNTLAPDEVIRLRGTPRMLGRGFLLTLLGAPSSPMSTSSSSPPDGFSFSQRTSSPPVCGRSRKSPSHGLKRWTCHPR